MVETTIDEDLLLQTCVLAGKLMMESGAEMYRVEDTMNRIIESKKGEKTGISFAMPTGIFVATNDGKNIQMQRISRRIHHLGRIAEINHLSRQFAVEDISLQTFYTELKHIELQKMPYSTLVKILASAIISGFMMILFKGSGQDFAIAALIGGLGYSIFLWCEHYMNLHFLPDFISAFFVGSLTQLAAHFIGLQNPDAVIIGSVMMLVPGVQITNAVRDFFAGNTISGTVFGLEALWIASMIGAGITMALRLF